MTRVVKVETKPKQALNVVDIFLKSIRNKEPFKSINNFLRPIPFFIAGGSIRDWITNNGKVINDIDIFFKSKEDYKMADDRFNMGFSLIRSTPNYSEYVPTKALSSWTKIQKYQLIKKEFFSTPQEVIETFDFTICSICLGFNMSPDSEQLAYHPWFLSDIMQRKLEIGAAELKWPLHTLKRAFKFSREPYNFNLPDSTLLAIGLELLDKDPKLANTENHNFYESD